METAPTYTTDCDKKRVLTENTNTNKASAISQNVKNEYERVSKLAC